MTRAGKVLGSRKRRLMALVSVVGLTLLAFVLLGIIAIKVWEYTNSVSFCTTTCHAVHPEEPVAHQDSYHALVKCTECHMGRVPTLQALVLKSTHARHLPAVLLHRYGRPLESETMRPANASCERCHWPQAFHDDAAREVRSFLPDRDNTEQRTYLLLRTGAGSPDTGGGNGIHWHISNVVEYIASDDEKQEIPWVRVTLADGRTVEYSDAANPLAPEEVAQGEKRVMDCIDCHNRVGHPFPSPQELVDQALAEGRLSRDLPFAKQEMLNLLAVDYPSQEEALAAVDSLRQRYRDVHPEVAVSYAAEIEAAVQVARELVARLVFEAPGVSWLSFADNNGHRVTVGCFRCHDGKHTSPEGETIRLQCTLCHSIPVMLAAGDEPPQMPIAWLQEPPTSHLGSNFIRDHRFLANDQCADCHGEVQFGDDGSSFCANSACHGLAWPAVDLDANFAHSVVLDGGHADTACYRCHAGVSQIEYDCANCHEPPEHPHFGSQCQACHGSGGFAGANADTFVHRTPLVGGHAATDCASCHASTPLPGDDCTTCHQPPGGHLAGSCDLCHTPMAWVGARTYTVARGGPIPHGLYSECAVCHDPRGPNWAAPASHLPFTDEQCMLCHSGGGSRVPLEDHSGVELLQGQHATLACVACHADGAFDDTPQGCVTCHRQDDTHEGQLGEDCAHCHSSAGWSRVSFEHRQTGFGLSGAHAGAACTGCHSNGTHAGTPQACVACHGRDDAHSEQFGQDCAQCHTTAGWPGASFDHSRTSFGLSGAHAGTACTGCHSNGTYAGTPQACVACHGPDDAHGGQFGQDCTQCHTTVGWPGASFDHNRTGFGLTGAHAGAACTGCHGSGTYAGTPQACAACHGEPGLHAGVLGTECAECHTTAGWLPASYNRPHTFPVGHRGSGSSSCRTCHPDTLAGYTCFACHNPGRIEEKHREEGISDYFNCVLCHPTGEERD